MTRILLIMGMMAGLISGTLFGQNPAADSLRQVWNDQEQVDSVRFEAAMSLIRMLFGADLESARNTSLALVEFAEQHENVEWQAAAYKYLGNCYGIAGEYAEALENYQKSLALSTSVKDEPAMATLYSNIGIVYYETGNFPVAIENLLRARTLSEKHNDKRNLSRVTNNLGNVYLRQDDYDKALENYMYSLELKEELGDRRSLPHVYNNIGLVHDDMGNLDKALENLEKSASIAGETGDRMARTRALGNIGGIYNRLGRYDEALEVLDECIEVKTLLKDRDGLAHAYLNRGRTYLNLKRYQQALQNCTLSYEMASEMDAMALEQEACQCLSQTHEALGNFQLSLQFLQRSSVLKDSLFNKEKTEEITRQEMLYTFEKEQLADSIAFHQARAEQELAFQRDLSDQRNKFNLIIFGGLGLLIIGAVYWRSRQKSIKLARERAVVARLRQVDQLKDQFLANTSHELRTPLNGIIGITESLRDGVAGRLSGKAQENLDMIANAGKRLANLINDLLDFSKLKNKDLVLSFSPVDLHAVADVVLRFSESLKNDKPLELVNNIPTDLPLAHADEDRVQQIFYNLVGNAIKFTPKGRVEITADKKGDMIAVSVRDTGIGIPKEHHEKIFESFEQGDGSTVREFGGTGLGLSVSRQLIDLHGGEIRVESEEGKGSVFTFTLPVSKVERAAFEKTKAVPDEELVQQIQAVDEPDHGVEVPVRTGEIRILVVDDEPVNRRVLQNHLSLAGYGVAEARHGEEALELLKNEGKFDLVLLDIMMPGMSGYEVCGKIREEYLPSELPIILLTARNRVSDLVMGFNAGANDYLTKPFSKNELLSRIKTHLNLQGIHRATSKFVPNEFIRSVGRTEITEVVLGDHVEKDVTVMFSDIRDYTSLAESMSPVENFKFVNSYVGKMGPIVHMNKGFVNQFLGDGIMALFPGSAANALKAAIGMQQKVREYNQVRTQKGYKPLSIGIGLHTGPLIMGIIGDMYRNDTAIIADTVNTSSRMEGLSKHFGAQIILSEDALSKVENPDEFGLRFLGRVLVKGKENPLGIYECFDGEEEEIFQLKQRTLKNFKKGMNHFLNYEFPKATAAFDHILSIHPGDQVARYFMSRSAEYTLAGVPKEEGFVNIMEEK